MKIAFLYENPLAHRTQFGVHSATCEKIFIHDPNTAESQVEFLRPDFLFVNKQFNIGVVKTLTRKGLPLAYFYGDYRNPVPEYIEQFMALSSVTLLTWYRSDIFKKYNAFTVRQGANPKIWRPIPNSPKKYDVIFTGSNFGSSNRLNMLSRLNDDFNLFVVGNGWPEHFNSTLRKSPKGTNKFLQSARVNVGIFNRQDLSRLKYYTSNRLYQGMACGKPHIGPRTDGLSEYFRETDHYFDYRSYSDLKKKINILIKNHSLRRRAGEAQRAAIIRENTVWHAWQRMEKIIANYIRNM